MKTLFGSAISASTDERETIAVPQIGEEDEGQVNHVPKSLLVGIIAPRIEETFELVRDRLEASGFDKIAGRRVVLTGGACQLHGAREFAALILDKQVRIGRPLRVAGLAEATAGPAFATTVGLFISRCRSAPRGPRLGARVAAEGRIGCSAASAIGCARTFEDELQLGCRPRYPNRPKTARSRSSQTRGKPGARRA